MHSSFTVETNTVKPNQSAPNIAILAMKIHKQMRKQTKIAVNSGRGQQY